MASEALDICTEGLYTSYAYNYPMESQQTLFRYSTDLDLASQKVAGIPLNQWAKNRRLERINQYKDLIISEDTHQILLGSLLGDGNLFIRKFSPRYSEMHCMEQEDYSNWKVSFFLRDNLKINKRIIIIKKNGSRINYPECVIETESIPPLLYYHYLFYGNGKKEINWRILQQLEPLGLAVWYMDDGCLYRKRGEIHIATHSFSKEQLELVKYWIKFRWDININIRPSNNSIGISTDSTHKFIDLIKPYVPECMNYKVDLIIKKCICGKNVGYNNQKYCDECNDKYVRRGIKIKSPCKWCSNELGLYKEKFCCRKCNEMYSYYCNKRVRGLFKNG